MVGLCALNLVSLSAARGADDFAQMRQQMVDQEIVGAGIRDSRVIKSMRDTERHEFVPSGVRANAYYDMALAIGNKQTISPPFIVAYMTEQLQPKPTDKVLEIGTGSGYQAAILSPLVKEVYTIEIVEPLAERAERTLQRLTNQKRADYRNVHVKAGDGYQGWPEHAPFDKIIVTCSPENIPEKLVEQLAEGGRLLIPVGERYEQTLIAMDKRDGELVRTPLLPMMFVPMTGAAEERRVVLPDPTKPAINNGGFEETVASVEAGSQSPQSPSGRAADQVPAVWYYQRQLKLVESPQAPEGKRYVEFTNSMPGRWAGALEGMAIDGRKVKELNFKLWVKATNVRPGELAMEQAGIVITFYNDNRAEVSHAWVGPWTGTFDWREFSETIRVPTSAREAIVRLGLNWATGEIAYDDVRVTGK